MSDGKKEDFALGYLPPLPELVPDGASRTVEDVYWIKERRPWIIERFSNLVYGRFPGAAFQLTFNNIGSAVCELDPNTMMRQVQIVVETAMGSHTMGLLLFLPKQAVGPVPVFIGLNFHGNHTVHPDTRIQLPQLWVRNNDEVGVGDNKANTSGRGSMSRRWPIEAIINHGFGLATLYCGDAAPDHEDIWQSGVARLFRNVETPRPANDWGAIGVWAWALQRGMDYLQKQPEVDPGRIAVIGHSRLGKAALWAGATDERFAVTISNNSGCGGAALSRRRMGETIRRINETFPHWFCPAFHQFNDGEDRSPVDQHMLIALMAPRPVYIASASKDLWADPGGEFLAAREASPAYEIFGRKGLGLREMPACSTSVGDCIGYHIRQGSHDLLVEDWNHFLQFIKKHHP